MLFLVKPPWVYTKTSDFPLILSFLQEKNLKASRLCNKYYLMKTRRITEKNWIVLKILKKYFWQSYASLKDDVIIQQKRAKKLFFASIDNKPWNDLRTGASTLEKYHAEYFALEVLSGNFSANTTLGPNILSEEHKKKQSQVYCLGEYR